MHRIKKGKSNIQMLVCKSRYLYSRPTTLWKNTILLHLWGLPTCSGHFIPLVWTTTKCYESINYSKRLTGLYIGHLNGTTSEQMKNNWINIKNMFAYQRNLYNVHMYSHIIKLHQNNQKHHHFSRVIMQNPVT